MSNALRMLTWILALALVALPVVAVFNGWIGADRWPLKRLRVTGELHRVDPKLLRTVLLPYAHEGFFAVNLRSAQDAVERLPWVESAQVRKRWPDVLEVSVVEHTPFARWDSDRLLSTDGALFLVPRNVDASALPQLGGPDGQVTEVVSLYNESGQLFAPMGLKVEALVMDARGSWSLRFDNGLDVVIGRTDARPRLERFARLLPRLLGDPRVLQRADLRYTNGFALTWGDAKPAADAASTPISYSIAAPRRQLATARRASQQAIHA
ncbi:cell division protein FtsQ/DivIB [Pseudoxanthomonas sp. JBR18]|uniref:cell division protein FtsQ/DivIB n=1 Tax=Pseudoxanthomonas sp. JBR18 TaxID=2969308 RepID=UPI00230590DC|nr:cell division protein FtsQ/DivIB [Pseudoxanthomonas sp. JBR18]WCE05107.1 cell division protein FtsQ/DivIB [Pseudoxanthomonas sp. JBR18]